MLDKTSFNIMLELCQDGRSTNAKLAQKLGVSVTTVAKRIKTMIEEDVIAIKAIPNPVKMGYRAAAFIGLKVDLRKIDRICAQLVDNPHINLAVTSFGRFDILLIVYFREWLMLQNFIKEELPRMDGVDHIETYLVSEARKRWRGKLFNDLTTNKPAPIDEIDRKLIEELMRYGRPYYATLSDKLGISISAVSRRVASLLEKNIIEIVAIPNPTKLGFSASAFILLHTEQAKVDNICNLLASYPEVHLVLRLMNDFDILFGVNTPNPEMLYEFFKSNIANIDGIVNTETFIRASFLHFSPGAMFLPSYVPRAE